jgi:hypothetical protein
MAKVDTFEGFIGKERARLEKARQEAIARKSEIEKELQSIDRELTAIGTYERAKTGKLPGPARRAGRRPGGRRGEKRQSILDLIKQHASGLSRGEILATLGVKGDKSAEQSVSNALTALKKTKQVSSREGKYVAT